MLKQLSFVAVTNMKWNLRVEVKQIKIKLKFSKEPVQDMRKSSIRFVLMIASVHIVCMIKCYFFFYQKMKTEKENERQNSSSWALSSSYK